MLRTVKQDWFLTAMVFAVLIGGAAKYFGAELLTGRAPDLDRETLMDLAEWGGMSLTVFLLAFSTFLWKWPLLHRVGLVKYPNLNGTWEGTLTPRRTGVPLKLNCTIKQSAWALSWNSWTPHSRNISVVTTFQERCQDEDQYVVLAILYKNSVNQGNAAKYSSDHDGACLLTLYKDDEETNSNANWLLEGGYWTNKVIDGVAGTTGGIVLRWRSKDRRPGFRDATPDNAVQASHPSREVSDGEVGSSHPPSKGREAGAPGLVAAGSS